MTASPESPRPSAQEAPKVEPPREIFARIKGAIPQLVAKEPLPPIQRDQAVRTILDGVIALHRQGQIGPVRDVLQTYVFTPAPATKIVADTLVADIEKSNTGRDPKGVRSLVELASTLGINDPGRFPDLAAKLGAIKVKTIRQNRSSNKQPKNIKEVAQTGQQGNPAEAPKSEYDFIPYATADLTAAVDEKDVAEPALYIAFTDIRPYLSKLPPSIQARMGQAMDQISKRGEEASEETARAYVQLCEILFTRGYTDKAIRRLAGLFSLDPSNNRAEELIPLLRAFSRLDSENPAVHQLLGDAYLQHGDYREAIVSYKEKLKIPPRE